MATTEKVKLTRPISTGEVDIYPETEIEQVSGLQSAIASAASGLINMSNQMYLYMIPDYYYRDDDNLFTSNKTSVTIPAGTSYVLNGYMYNVTSDTIVSISITAANRKGKDLYIYAVETSNHTPSFVISDNSTYPSGYTDTTSRKLGGFHCLCADVGTIESHPLSGYVAGDILPASRWDLLHRPSCSPEGMVYDEGSAVWVDIYLSSVLSTVDFTLQSVNGAVIADGESSPKFHWYKFAQWMANSGKRLPDQAEFISFSTGSNQGTNISGSADPNTTGGHVDTASPSRRMISNIGCEDCCGVLWQWGNEAGGPYNSGSNVAQYDGNDDSGQRGSGWSVPNRALFGACWGNGVSCGSRASAWPNAPLSLVGVYSARGVCVSRAY